jgi:hypothetical protein
VTEFKDEKAVRNIAALIPIFQNSEVTPVRSEDLRLLMTRYYRLLDRMVKAETALREHRAQGKQKCVCGEINARQVHQESDAQDDEGV